jgi:hypothetical protein
MERFNAIAAAWQEDSTRTELARVVAVRRSESIPSAATECAMEVGCGTDWAGDWIDCAECRTRTRSGQFGRHIG